MKQISAVIFDMDGTIIDSEPLWQRAEISGFKRVGVSLTVEDCKQTIGVRIDQVVEHWYRKFPWPEVSLDAVRESILDGVCFLMSTEGTPKSGVPEAIALLRERGLPLAIASASYQRIIETALRKLGIFDAFSVIHSAEFEKLGKPDPAVYLTTAKKLGVEPERCLVFEDSLAGIRAAKAAGMTCVAVAEEATPFEAAQSIADYSLTSFADLARAPWFHLFDSERV